MCSRSYKAPKAEATPKPPPAPVEGAQAPVVDSGGQDPAAQLQSLAAAANPLVVPFSGKLTGPNAMKGSLQEIRRQAQDALGQNFFGGNSGTVLANASGQNSEPGKFLESYVRKHTGGAYGYYNSKP